MGYKDLIMSPVLLAQQSWMQLKHAESMSAKKEDGRSSLQNRRGPGARPLLPLQGAIPWEVCGVHITEEFIQPPKDQEHLKTHQSYESYVKQLDL